MRFAVLILCFLCASAAGAQTPRYFVKLTPDFDGQTLRGEETIEFEHPAGKVEWQKQAGLRVLKANSGDADITVQEDGVSMVLRNGGEHKISFEFSTSQLSTRPARGMQWFKDREGMDTAFYCEAWMVCDNSPGQTAEMTLEIVLSPASGLTAVGPGQFKKQWRDKEGEHFVFEQREPVQTYLFSFGVARLNRVEDGRFIFYTQEKERHKKGFLRTADAYAFLRGKAGVDLGSPHYTQAAMVKPIEQEAAALALMPKDFLVDLEERDDPSLVVHELAHQWWGVLVGIRSWSDFWLNEGMADFMKDVYLEKTKGKSAYDHEIQEAKQRMEELRAQGQDRPLHWDGWKDAHGALGRVPYVKGVLFLDRLRTEVGDDTFWRGIALYTTRSAHKLVDSRDFERAMEDASHRDLKPLFQAGVYE